MIWDTLQLLNKLKGTASRTTIGKVFKLQGVPRNMTVGEEF